MGLQLQAIQRWLELGRRRIVALVLTTRMVSTLVAWRGALADDVVVHRIFRLLQFGIGFSLAALLYTEQSSGPKSTMLLLAPILSVFVIDSVRWHFEAVLVEQREALTRLLDKATDGFCAVEVAAAGETARLTHMSEKLKRTLRCRAVDVAAQDVFATTDDLNRFRAMMTSMERKGSAASASACMVTCVTASPASEEFEVRLLPVRKSQGEILISFQVASERRKVAAAELLDDDLGSVVGASVSCRSVAQIMEEVSAGVGGGASPQREVQRELSWDCGSWPSLAYSMSAIMTPKASARPRFSPKPTCADASVQTDSSEQCGCSPRPPLPPQEAKPTLLHRHLRISSGRQHGLRAPLGLVLQEEACGAHVADVSALHGLISPVRTSTRLRASTPLTEQKARPSTHGVAHAIKPAETKLHAGQAFDSASIAEWYPL